MYDPFASGVAQPGGGTTGAPLQPGQMPPQFAGNNALAALYQKHLGQAMQQFPGQQLPTGVPGVPGAVPPMAGGMNGNTGVVPPWLRGQGMDMPDWRSMIGDYRTAIQDWRGDRPDRPQGGFGGDPSGRQDWRSSMQDWRSQRPTFSSFMPGAPGA
jgi:hypothetical protein